jgi:hypothetical protein
MERRQNTGAFSQSALKQCHSYRDGPLGRKEGKREK